MKLDPIVASGAALLAFTSALAAAVPFSFNTGNLDGRIGTATRPSNDFIETESADDFILTTPITINTATFTGLLTGGLDASSIGNVRVEIYRVFPFDSTDPPSGNVPTRVNSPSDVAFAERESASGTLSFSVTSLGPLSAANSVINGINAIPNQTTGGEGAVSGTGVQFSVNLGSGLTLPADHYFFVPQVEVTSPNGQFLWLSTVRPIVSPGDPFAPDLQAWIRNENLAPDWLRIGTDIVGGTGAPAPTFNMAFSLQGQTQVLPEPSTVTLFGAALIGAFGVFGKRGAATKRRHA